MDELVLKQLYEPFQLRERKGVGNKTFKYVETSDIVDRMNRVFKGEWSTEVRDVEIIEDYVLMRVRVYVPSSDGKQVLWQDGYASHPLTRHAGGSNAGKIVDIGNSYKAAMSKAIKTAVAKWGVALNLDEDSEHEGSFASASMGFTPMTTESKPSISSAPIFEPSIPVAKKEPVVTEDVASPFGFPGVNQSVKSESSAQSFGFNPMPNSGMTKATTSNMGFTPVPTFMPENSGRPEPSFDSGIVASSDVVMITSVQKVAVEQVMSHYGLTFPQLVAKSIDRTTDLPSSLDNVTYLDAVKLIQYGNNLRKL